MDGRKVLAILGILGFVWPGALILVAIPFVGLVHLLGLTDSRADSAISVLGIVICPFAATWISVLVYKRAFRET